jgi:UDP-glucose 4-epimerase
LITGGAGFIGSHLTELLLGRGDTVTILDDFSTGRIENLEGFERHPRLTIIQDSLFHNEVTAKLIESTDATFHLAAVVGVQLIVKERLHTLQTNIRGSDIVLEAATKYRKPLLIASTSEVYGKSTALPYREDGDIVLGATSGCRWGYAASKAVDEFLALAYGEEKGVPVVITRLFNTVGPRQTGRYGMVVPRFVRQALTGEPLTVYGDGTQRRCFGSVSDVTRGLVGLLDDPRSYGKVFNVGNDQEISIGDLARKVIEKTGGRSGIRLIPFTDVYGPTFEDMVRRIPDLTKIKAQIGYRPRVGLDEILDQVIAHERRALARETGTPRLAKESIR